MLKEPPPHDCDLWVTVIDRDFDTDWELAEHQLYLIIDIFLVLSQDSCVIFCKIHLFKYLNPESPLFTVQSKSSQSKTHLIKYCEALWWLASIFAHTN